MPRGMNTDNLIRVRKALEQKIKEERSNTEESVAECIRKCRQQTKNIRSEEHKRIRNLLKRLDEVKKRQKSSSYREYLSRKNDMSNLLSSSYSSVDKKALDKLLDQREKNKKIAQKKKINKARREADALKRLGIKKKDDELIDSSDINEKIKARLQKRLLKNKNSKRRMIKF